MSKYQTMVFSIDRYSWNTSEEEARELMWKDISIFLRILFRNNNVAVIYDDETDIIVIQYEHNENVEAWGGAFPHWVTEDELWNIEYVDEIANDKE